MRIRYGKLLLVRGRGVAANMRPCQGRDRGFEPRRSRQNKKTIISLMMVFDFEAQTLNGYAVIFQE
jgi:hypothetical protein